MIAPISDSYTDFMYGWYRPLTLWRRNHRAVDVPPPEEGPEDRIINETIDLSVFERVARRPSVPPSERGQMGGRQENRSNSDRVVGSRG